MRWNIVRFHEILFQTDAESFSFLSWKKKKLFVKKKNFGRCQYQNKKALFTDSIFREGFGPYIQRKPPDSSNTAAVLHMVDHHFPIDIIDTSLSINTTTKNQGTHSRSCKRCHFTCMASESQNQYQPLKSSKLI